MFYRYFEERYQDNAIRKAKETGYLTEDDELLIRQYVTEYRALRQVSQHRVRKATTDLVLWRRFIKVPYRSCTVQDVYAGITAMQNGNSLKGKPFSQNTKHDYIKILKLFIIWLIENGYSVIPAEKIRAIRPPGTQFQTTTPDEILTPEEVKAMIEACQESRDRSRDRAIIATLYESGCRIGELARVKWRDIVFDAYGVRLNITDMKTRRLRYARLVMAREYLVQWKNDTHFSTDDSAEAFVSMTGKPLEYGALVMMIRRTAKRAGITKRVHPHLFRKSRITHLIQQNYQESVIKQMMWGNLATDMFRAYVVLSPKDIDDEVLDRCGIRKKNEEKPMALEPRQCPNCLKVHAPTTKYCECGMPLTLDAMSSREAMRQALKEDPESVLNLIRELLETK